MSRAFTKESDREERMGAPAPPLPPGIPNYITVGGAARLRAERARLLGSRPAAKDIDGAEARERLAIANERIQLIEAREATWVELPVPAHPGRVVFGCTVTVVAAAGGTRTVTLVGVDEVDVPAGRISFLSPLARALIGAEVGDVVSVASPRGEEEIEVVGIGG